MIKLKKLATERFLFVQMGAFGFVSCLVVGVMSLFSLDLVKAARIVDLMISVTAAVGVGGTERTCRRRSWPLQWVCIEEGNGKSRASQKEQA